MPSIMVAALAAAFAGAPSQQPLDTSLATFADTVLREEMRRARAPGAVLLVVRDGAVAVALGQGLADVDRRTPMDPERTVLRVGSVSKLFVATAVMQLAERGRVELDADVNGYLRGVRVAGGDSRPVTLAQLLTHTGGFDERNIGYAARSAAEVIPLGRYLADRMPPRTRAPGTVTSYSNHGAALAGYVVESVAGMPFSEYARREILLPVGMQASGFEQPPAPALRAALVTPYPCGAEEGRAGCAMHALDYRHTYPAGSLLATGADMGRFMIAHLEDGGPLLRDSTMRAMHARHFTHHPMLPGMAYGFFEQTLNGESVLSHGGGLPGANTLLVLVPGRRLGIFLHANGGATTFGGAVLHRLADRILRAPEGPEGVDERARVGTPAAPGADPPARFAGVYRSTRYARRSIENLPELFASPVYVSADTGRGGSLVVSGLGGGAVRYEPVAPLVFREVRGGGEKMLAFRADASGRITRMFGAQSFFGSEFPGAFERLAWYDAPHFVNELLSWAFMIPLLVLAIAWPATAGVVTLWKRRRRRDAYRTTSGSAGAPSVLRRDRVVAIGAAAAFAALTLAFGFGFLARSVRLLENAELLYGLTPAMRVLAWAPWAIVALAIGLCVLSVRAWRKRYWSLAGRLYFVAIALDALVMVAVLVRWSYLPARY
ncbi:MAG TPA: serine hydrolase domain-containing protein [Gemmatimonadaceae bacterium]|nr:serine hydrolase domain-containing protein [Gemmatimonadaceae bacterium]